MGPKKQIQCIVVVLSLVAIQSACAPNMQEASVEWSSFRTSTLCPPEGRYSVHVKAGPRCIDRTGMDKEPCQFSNAMANLWKAKTEELFQESGCTLQSNASSSQPELHISFEEIRFEGGHDTGRFLGLFSMLFIPGYIYMGSDIERGVTGSVHLSMVSPRKKLLWEATVHHQELYEAGMSSGWAIDSASSNDAPVFDDPTTQVMSILLSKTFTTTERLNKALRKGAQP